MLSSMEDLLKPRTKGGVEVFHLPEPARSEDLAVLQYTGGTTGLSKGAMLTHRNLLSNALQTRHWTPKARDGEEIGLCVAPFFHSYGLTVGMNLSIYAAATMVLAAQVFRERGGQNYRALSSDDVSRHSYDVCGDYARGQGSR